jgi:hypothetical protein
MIRLSTSNPQTGLHLHPVHILDLAYSLQHHQRQIKPVYVVKQRQIKVFYPVENNGKLSQSTSSTQRQVKAVYFINTTATVVTKDIGSCHEDLTALASETRTLQYDGLQEPIRVLDASVSGYSGPPASKRC